MCGVTFTKKGTQAGEQKTGDCSRQVCDGEGALEAQTDTTDVLDDGNPCTVDTCDDNQPKNTLAAAGTACSGSGQAKVCNDKGACVECATGADCGSGVCQNNACVAASCADTVKNGDETDTDCGGGCGPCADTKACAEAKDCTSGVCTGNVCQAASCTDGVKNGNETALDCGGATCAKCGPDLGCTVNDDCLGGSCRCCVWTRR